MMVTEAIPPAAGELPQAVFDPARLAAVTASGLLDTAAEGTFDDLARLALAVTGTRMAFFTVADGRRSFWKSAIGVDPTAGRENDIRDSPCHILIGAAHRRQRRAASCACPAANGAATCATGATVQLESSSATSRCVARSSP